jgi:integrase/recombinase XerD
MQDDRYGKILEEFPKANKGTYLEFLNQYGNGLTQGTKINHGYVLKSLAEFAGKPYKKITKEDIAEWLETLNGKGDNTIRRYKATIKAFYKWLDSSDDYPDKVKWIKYRVKKSLPKNVPCELEIKKLISAADHARDKALLFALYESGARISEILGLKIGDINFDKYGAFFVVDGKTGQRRIRLIDAVPDLQAWINKHPLKDNRDAPLWPNMSNPKIPLDYNASRAMLIRISKRAGIPRMMHAHLLRHCRLTQLAKDFSESELKVMAGWAGDSRMAGVYVHLSGGDVERKMLENRGMLQPEDKPEVNIMTPRPCPRKCSEVRDGKEHVIIYSATDKFCMKCGMALDLKTAMELEDSQKDIDKSLSALIDSKIEELIEKRASDILEEKLKALTTKG